MVHKDVRILITGGTLDKIHDPFTESLAFSQDGATQIPEILHYGRCDFPAIQQVMQIDSLHMTDDHRGQIVAAITAAPESAIVITHGTSTMGETARFIAAADVGKTVVSAVLTVGLDACYWKPIQAGITPSTDTARRFSNSSTRRLKSKQSSQFRRRSRDWVIVRRLLTAAVVTAPADAVEQSWR